MNDYQRWLLSQVGTRTDVKEMRYLDQEALGFSKVLDHKLLDEYVHTHFESTVPMLEFFQVGDRIYPYYRGYPELAAAHYYLKHFDKVPVKVHQWKSWDQVEAAYEILNGTSAAGTFKAWQSWIPPKSLKESHTVSWKDFLTMNEAGAFKSFEKELGDGGSGLYQAMANRASTYFQQVESMNQMSWESKQVPEVSSPPVTKVPRIYGHTGVSKSAMVESIPSKVSIEVDLQFYGYNGGELLLQLPPRVTVVKTGQFDPTDFSGMSSDMPIELFEKIVGKKLTGFTPTVDRVQIDRNTYIVAPVKELWENSDQAVVQSRMILAELANRGYIQIFRDRTWDSKIPYKAFTYVELTEAGRKEGLNDSALLGILYYARPVIFFLDEFSRSDPKAVTLWMTLLTARTMSSSITFNRTFFVLADNEVSRDWKEELRVFYSQMYQVSGDQTGLNDPATNDRFDQIYVDESDRALQLEVVNYLSEKFADIPQVRPFLLAVQDAGFLYSLPRPRQAVANPDVEVNLQEASALEEKYPTFRGWEFVLKYLQRCFKNSEPVSIYVLESILGALNRKVPPQAAQRKPKVSDITASEKMRDLEDLQDLFDIYFRGGNYQSNFYRKTDELRFDPKSLQVLDSESESYIQRLQQLVHSNVPVLLLGRPGVAKTAISQELARLLNKDAADSNKVTDEMIRQVFNLETEERGMVRGSPALTEFWSDWSPKLFNILEEVREERNYDMSFPTLASGRPEIGFLSKIERLRRDPKAYLVVVFDELNRTTEIKQAIVLDAISNHKLYGVDFSDVADRVAIVATSNYYRGTTAEELGDDSSGDIYYGVAALDHAVMARFATFFLDKISEKDLESFIEYWSRKLAKVFGKQTGKPEEDLIRELKTIFNGYQGELLEYFNVDLKRFKEYREEHSASNLQILSPRGFSNLLEKILTIFIYRVFYPGDEPGVVRFANNVKFNLDLDKWSDDYLEVLKIMAVARYARYSRGYESFYVGNSTLDKVLTAILRDIQEFYRSEVPWNSIPTTARIPFVAEALLKAHEAAQKDNKKLPIIRQEIMEFVQGILRLDGILSGFSGSLENQFRSVLNSEMSRIYQRQDTSLKAHKDFLADLVKQVYSVFSSAYQEHLLKSLSHYQKDPSLSKVSLVEWGVIDIVLPLALSRFIQTPGSEDRRVFTAAQDYPALLEILTELSWTVKGQSLEELWKDPAALQELMDHILRASASNDLTLPKVQDYNKPFSETLKVTWTHTQQKSSAALMRFVSKGSSSTVVQSSLNELHSSLWNWMFRLWAQGIPAEHHTVSMVLGQDALENFDVIFAPVFPGGLYLNDPIWIKSVQKPAKYEIIKDNKTKIDIVSDYVPFFRNVQFSNPVLGIPISGANEAKTYFYPGLRIGVVRSQENLTNSNILLMLDVFEIPVTVEKLDLKFFVKNKSDHQVQQMQLTIALENKDQLTVVSELYQKTIPILSRVSYEKDNSIIDFMMVDASPPYYVDDQDQKESGTLVVWKTKEKVDADKLKTLVQEYLITIYQGNNQLLQKLAKATEDYDKLISIDKKSSKVTAVASKKPPTVKEVSALPDPARYLRKALDLLDI